MERQTVKIEKYQIKAELLEEFTQAQYEKYQTRLLELTKDITIVSIVERAIVQAALDAGILTNIEKPLPDLPAKVLRWLTIKVRDFVAEQTEVPQD